MEPSLRGGLLGRWNADSVLCLVGGRGYLGFKGRGLELMVGLRARGRVAAAVVKQGRADASPCCTRPRGVNSQFAVFESGNWGLQVGVYRPVEEERGERGKRVEVHGFKEEIRG